MDASLNESMRSSQDPTNRSFEGGKLRRKRSQRSTKGNGDKSGSKFVKSLAMMRQHTQAAREAKSEKLSQKLQSKSMASPASNVVEFANMLLAKHEANME